MGLCQVLRMGWNPGCRAFAEAGDLAGPSIYFRYTSLWALHCPGWDYFLGKYHCLVLFYVCVAVIPIPEVGVFDEVLTAASSAVLRVRRGGPASP